MPLLVKEEIYRDFAFAGAVPQYPNGATQAELRDLYAQDPKGAYVQYCFDRIVIGQDDPLVREMQANYPRTPGHIRQMMERFTPRMWEPLFDQTLGYAPSHRPQPVLASPVASQTLSIERPKPVSDKLVAELTPEELASRRAATLERVHRHRQSQRSAWAEAKHDSIAAEEQTRHAAFASEFAGQITAEVSPATLEGKDEPAPEGPSWQ